MPEGVFDPLEAASQPPRAVLGKTIVLETLVFTGISEADAEHLLTVGERALVAGLAE